jgi:hypothetical protein
MLFSDKFADVAARFINWLGNSNSGNSNVVNLALDYLNRAQASLCNEAPRGWTYLTKDHVQLNLIPAAGGNPAGGVTGLEYALPADLGVLLMIYVDTTLTYKPTVYYSKDGKIMFGFNFNPNFDKATGYASTVKFFYTPINIPYCRYQIQLVPFIASTADEFCAFPGDLVLLEAQKIRCADKGLTSEWGMLRTMYEDYLSKFKKQNQNIAGEIQPTLNDGFGNPVIIPEFGLASGMRSRQIMGRRNDMDVTRY